MELSDTVSLMTSDDWRERFKAEYLQTKIRCKKLESMIRKLNVVTFVYVPESYRDILINQLHIMQTYLNVLKIRASIEDIDVDSSWDEVNDESGKEKV